MKGDHQVFAVCRKHASLAVEAEYPIGSDVIRNLRACEALRFREGGVLALPVRTVTVSYGGRRVSVEPRTPVLTHGRA